MACVSSDIPSIMSVSGDSKDLARTITPPVPHHENGHQVVPQPMNISTPQQKQYHRHHEPSGDRKGNSPVSDPSSDGSPRTIPTTPPSGWPDEAKWTGSARCKDASGVRDKRSIAEKLKTELLEKIKRKVSKNKKRHQFQDDISGRTFDLSYIEDRIVAMGFPSSGLESYYRNSIDEIEANLNRRHGHSYRVYNLCVEKGKRDGYEKTRFNGNQRQFGFYDHCPPTFLMILEFCKDAYDYLEENQDNVVVVHCKAGKGRTGSMICCLLIYISYRIEVEEEERQTSPGAGSALGQSFNSNLSSASSTFCTKPRTAPSGIPYPTYSKVHIREVLSAEAAMEYYALKRTHDNKGVTIPSQKRAIKYMEIYFKHRLRYPEHRRAHMLRLTLKNLPKCYRDDLWFEIRQWDPLRKTYRQITNNKAPGPNQLKWEDPVFKHIGPIEQKNVKRGWTSKMSLTNRGDRPLPVAAQVQWEPNCGSTLDGMVKLDFYYPTYQAGEKPIFSATFDTFFHSLPQHIREEINRTTPVQHSLAPSPCQGMEEKVLSKTAALPAGEHLRKEKLLQQEEIKRQKKLAEELRTHNRVKAEELAYSRTYAWENPQGNMVSNTASISSEMYAFDGQALSNNSQAASIPQFKDISSNTTNNHSNDCHTANFANNGHRRSRSPVIVQPPAPQHGMRGCSERFTRSDSSNSDDMVMVSDQMVGGGGQLPASQRVGTQRLGLNTAGVMGGHEVPSIVHIDFMCSKNDKLSQVGNMISSNTVLPNQELSSTLQNNNTIIHSNNAKATSANGVPQSQSVSTTRLSPYDGPQASVPSDTYSMQRPQLTHLIKWRNASGSSANGIIKETESESLEKLLPVVAHVTAMNPAAETTVIPEQLPVPVSSKRISTDPAWQNRCSAFGTPPKATKAYGPTMYGQTAGGSLSVSTSSTPNSAFSKPMSSTGNSPLCVSNRGDKTLMEGSGVFNDLLVHANEGTGFTSSDAPSAADEYLQRTPIVTTYENYNHHHALREGEATVSSSTSSVIQPKQPLPHENHIQPHPRARVQKPGSPFSSIGEAQINDSTNMTTGSDAPIATLPPTTTTSSKLLHYRVAGAGSATYPTNASCQSRPASSSRTHTTSTTSSSTVNTVRPNSTGSSATLGSSNPSIVPQGEVTHVASSIPVRGTADGGQQVPSISQRYSSHMTQTSPMDSVEPEHANEAAAQQTSNAETGSGGGSGFLSAVPDSIYGELTLREDEEEPNHQRLPTSVFMPYKSTERTFVFNRDELDGFAKDKVLEAKFQENFQVVLYCQDNMSDVQGDNELHCKFLVQSFEYDQIRPSHVRLEAQGRLPRSHIIDTSARSSAGNQADTSSSSSEY